PPEFIGNLRMGLLGACASKFPEKFNVMKHESGLPKFGLAIQYEYESVFRTNITFKYNLYKFFEVIRKSGSRGGLFSSKSWSSVTEKEGGEDAIHVSWDEEDPDNVISETDKREIEKEIKAELIARVLRMMAIPAIGPQQGLAPVPPMPENGAVIAARGLEQGCGHLSHYCVAGSWILKVANGIFGSSRTEQSFRKEWDYEAT